MIHDIPMVSDSKETPAWFASIYRKLPYVGLTALRWRHNGRDYVSNHQPHNCLLNRNSGTDQSKHQSSASLAFVWGNHRGPVNSTHKWPVTRKMFPFYDVIMCVDIDRSPRYVSMIRVHFQPSQASMMVTMVTVPELGNFRTANSAAQHH